MIIEKVDRILSFVGGAYRENEYPALKRQMRRFAAEKPLAGKSVLDCTPLFRNTLLKFVPLILSDCRLTVGISDRVPYDEEILRFLDEVEIPYVRDDTPAEGFDIILDCDGTRSDVTPRIGACELTGSGRYYYQDKDYPVILVDASRIKEIETAIGTGNGFMRAMQELGHEDWKGKRVVVFGLGKVGRGVAYYCRKEGALVTVVDSAEALLRNAADYSSVPMDRVDLVRSAVAESDYLVTATGVRGAMARYGLADLILSGKTEVVNIGIEDEWLDSLPKERIVNGGKAVNFILKEPTLLRYIDPTMALSNQSAADLVTREVAKGIVCPFGDSESRCLDEVIACGLIRKELEDFGFGEDSLK